VIYPPHDVVIIQLIHVGPTLSDQRHELQSMHKDVMEVLRRPAAGFMCGAVLAQVWSFLG